MTQEDYKKALEKLLKEESDKKDEIEIAYHEKEQDLRDKLKKIELEAEAE